MNTHGLVAKKFINNNYPAGLLFNKSTHNCLSLTRTVNSSSRNRLSHRGKKGSKRAVGLGLPAAYRRRSNKNNKNNDPEQRSYKRYSNKYKNKQHKDSYVMNDNSNGYQKYELLQKTFDLQIRKTCDIYSKEPTEQNYRQACLQLRKAISSLSSIRFDHNNNNNLHHHYLVNEKVNTENNYKNTPNYFQSAFQYLQQLEELRLLHSKQLSPFMDSSDQNYSNQKSKLIKVRHVANSVKEKRSDSNVSNEDPGLFSRIWGHFFQSSKNQDLHIQNKNNEESIIKMSAHLSSDYTANLQLYRKVMKSCLYHHRHLNKKDNDHNFQEKSDKMNIHSLRNQLQKIIHQMEKFYHLGNIHVQPDISIYQYFSYSLTTLKDVEQNLLISPSNKKNNINNFVKENYYDELQVLILKTLKQIIMSDSCSLHDKPLIVETADRTWEELLSSLTASQNNQNTTPIKEEALQYLLTIYKNAGRKCLPDACTRVDNLLPHVFSLPINDSTEIDADEMINFSPNLVVHHLILSIFANSNSLEYLLRAHDILKQMEQYNYHQRKQISFDQHQRNNNNNDRSDQDKDFDDSYPDEIFNLPSTQTYNNIMKGIVHFVISNPKQKQKNDSDKNNEDLTESFITPAMWLSQCVDYLDVMILNHNESSRPNRTTFSHLLKLCAYSKSPDAGDVAQRLLSRIQVLDLITMQQKTSSQGLKDEIIIHPSLYVKVMDCWKTSAWSGRKDAASSAQSFLNRIQAQCSKSITMIGHGNENDMKPGYIANAYFTPTFDILKQNQLSEKDDDNVDNSYYNGDSNEHQEIPKSYFNDNMFPNKQVFYHILIRTCSITRLREDKPKALQIAFDTYREMIDSSVIPGWEIYSTLLQCCRHLCSTPQHRYELSQTVFEAACQHGRVNSILLKELKKTNGTLYRSYQPSPEHSMYTT